MTQVSFRRENGTLCVETHNHEPTLTQQQFRDEVDINNIIAKYSRTGELPLVKRIGAYTDLTNAKDYVQSMQTIIEANSAFETLSPKVRSRFNNDPAQLLSFLEDPNNQDEGISLGLLNPITPPISNSLTPNSPTPNSPTPNSLTPNSPTPNS